MAKSKSMTGNDGGRKLASDHGRAKKNRSPGIRSPIGILEEGELTMGTKKSKPEQSGGVNEQDEKRRLGNFGGAGEHPRQGGRTSGIVGQKKQQNKTDKGKK
jgi:hypothetical protein